MDYGGGRLRVSWVRVPETPEKVAVYVAAQEGVPAYPGSGARGGPIVSSSASIGEVIRKLNPILNGVYLFPGGEQQPDLPSDRLGRAEPAAVMAPTQTSMQLAIRWEALELPVPL